MAELDEIMQDITAQHELFELHAAFCSIFTSSTRLRIMWILARRECTVTEIAEALQLRIANVSQHLRVMRDQNAVATRREGNTVVYSISNSKFFDGATLIREGILEEIRKRTGCRAAG